MQWLRNSLGAFSDTNAFLQVLKAYISKPNSETNSEDGSVAEVSVTETEIEILDDDTSVGRNVNGSGRSADHIQEMSFDFVLKDGASIEV